MTTIPLYELDAYKSSCDTVVVACDGNTVTLEKTVFYPLGGGQLGDTGKLTWGNASYNIIDTAWADGNQISHVLDAVLPEETRKGIVGSEVKASIDWSRRYQIMRLHTALHVLYKVVPFRCTGAKVGPEKAHLDFDTEGEKLDSSIVDELNEILSRDLPVFIHSVSESEVQEKPDLAATIRLAPPVRNGHIRFVQIGSNEHAIDLQPCGGTHVHSTGEIGEVVVLKNRSRGSQNRRLTVGLKTVLDAPHQPNEDVCRVGNQNN